MTARTAGWDPEALENAEKRAKRAPFSSTAATLKWARSVWGDEPVANASYWLNFGAEEGGDGPAKRRGPGGVRKDLYGFIDVVVLDGLPGLLALQACGTDVGEHVRKMNGEVRRLTPGPKLLKAQIDAAKLAGRVRRWLAAGNRLLLVAWRDVWVKTSEKHQARKRMPRFLEARLEPHPPGVTLGLSDREVEWVEHEHWPPTIVGEALKRRA